MAQQTAVDWLDNEEWKLRLKLRGGEVSIKFYLLVVQSLILQAKEIEKQQMMDAWINGNNTIEADDLETKKWYQEYYTETYRK